jgi:spore maturation protein SpmA
MHLDCSFAHSFRALIIGPLTTLSTILPTQLTKLTINTTSDTYEPTTTIPVALVQKRRASEPCDVTVGLTVSTSASYAVRIIGPELEALPRNQ